MKNQTPILLTVLFMFAAGCASLHDKAHNQWGTFVNPAGDCMLEYVGEGIRIIAPGSQTPHDLGAELASRNAPRLIQPVYGDFVIQVKVDAGFQPGTESTQRQRTAYGGAGLVVFADEANYIRMERATLRRPGQDAVPYINFEIRVDGNLEQFGVPEDFPIEEDKATWLRLERKDGQMLGMMSHDGRNWVPGQPKELRSAAWSRDLVSAGVAAVSTSRETFAPFYSDLKITQGERAE